jgi:hypothetical protein
LGQKGQFAQAPLHLREQGIAISRVATCADFVLRHPRSQVLLGGRQLHKTLVDVAGQAPAHHLALCLAQGKHCPHALQNNARRQKKQDPAELSSEHLCIVAAVA